MKKTSRLNDFRFLSAGHGHYRVSYVSPKTGRLWSRVTNDMQLIDATKNSEVPKQKDLEILKKLCKNQ